MEIYFSGSGADEQDAPGGFVRQDGLDFLDKVSWEGSIFLAFLQELGEVCKEICFTVSFKEP